MHYRSSAIRRRPNSRLLGPLVLVALIAAVDGQELPAQEPEPAERLLQAERIFDPAHIVEVSVELEDEDWKKLCAQSRQFFRALGDEAPESPFTYFSANVTIDGKTIENVGIRKKGFFGSLDSRRPSLKIKFHEFDDQTPSVGFDRLTLNNNKSDPSRLSQYLAYKIFNDSGTVAPRCNFARVTVNGKYLGIYSNVESIKRPFLKQRFGDDSGALFEGAIADFYPDSVKRFEKKNKQAKYKHVRKLAEIMDRDEFTLEELGEVLDVPAFVKYWATESLIGFFDGYTNNQNNFFFYRHPETKTFQFIPWGADTAFFESAPIPNFKAEVKSVHSKSVLASRLYYREDTQQLYFKTINDLLDNHWDEDALIADIDATVELLEEHILPENRQFARRVESTRSFIRGRRKTVEKDLEGGVAKITKGSRRQMSFKVIGKATGTFSTQWSEKTPKNPSEHGKVDLKVVFGEKPLDFRTLGVTAEPNKDRRRREPGGGMPPSVIFHGHREPDNKRWMLALSTSSDAFHPSPKPAGIGGIVIEGNPALFFTMMMLNKNSRGNIILVGGTATLDQASREEGAPVSGTVELDFGKFQGGDNLPLR